MCGLCGVFGVESHWTDSAGRDATLGGAAAPNRAVERARRVELANRVLEFYGLVLADWGGHAYVLRDRTGRSAIVQALSELWPAAERLAGRPCDPLDPALHDALARAV